MTIYDDGQTMLCSGDAVEVVRQLPMHSVDCVVTSPPYWGLRDYRVGRQLGAEATVDEYVERLALLFDELAGVLAPWGTVWLNLGDSYGGSWGYYVAAGSGARTAAQRSRNPYGTHRPPQASSRAKDLVGVPWRVVLELMSRGWLLEREIIWHKPNARPESVRDRFAHQYENIFVLARDRRDRCETGETSVWSVSSDRGRVGHPAKGTLEIARRCVRMGCRPGGTVLDPFSGSGTTGIAAREHRCRYIGVDLNPEWHELALQRLGLSNGS
ncbi:site-specific DNA-methyltransferase [Amycolatopsis sp. WQ 127309]|uniref:DNA-methyltransferase n=1 Tax=Amycolatopsis sp. WQ 127309 TaxID=2932773 RepID=UPI001FF20E3B|nr:site-specific DNA-methyltransferase [Amycolatopsis sp. WQ 127309]UOZ06892.1 site-specific DNA-methyltransferase [Amycolatopsis sp. WQ 127309]